MRTFIDRDPQKALVILTTREYPIQHTLVGLIEALLVDEESAGNLTVPTPTRSPTRHPDDGGIRLRRRRCRPHVAAGRSRRGVPLPLT